MAVNGQAVLEVCKIVTQLEQFKVPTQQTSKEDLIKGLGVALGGFLGGPVGAEVGCCLGKLVAYQYKKLKKSKKLRKFRSVSDILSNDLTPEQKSRLTDSIGKILNNVSAQTDVTNLATMVLTDQSLKLTVLEEISSFLDAELNLSMMKA